MFNQVTVVGRLGADPELKYTQGGKAVATGSIAVPRPGKDKKTDWIRFQAWDKTAEATANWGRKGNRILISGRLQVDEWQDREGNKRSSFYVNARDVTFIDWPEEESKPAPAKEEKAAEPEGNFPF